jgi:hypothetical protein
MNFFVVGFFLQRKIEPRWCATNNKEFFFNISPDPRPNIEKKTHLFFKIRCPHVFWGRVIFGNIGDFFARSLVQKAFFFGKKD